MSNQPAAGFDQLVKDLRTDSVFTDKIGDLRSEDLKVDALLRKLLDQGGPLSFFSRKLSADQRATYVSMLKTYQEPIDAALKSYIMTMTSPDDMFSAYFWFKNGNKDASEFDTSLFWELISLDLPNIDFKQYQTSRGTTVQSMINRLYTLARQDKTNSENPLRKFLWNYLRKEIKYCETLHDMMSSLPTHPAVTEIKQVLKPHDTVDLPVIIDKLLQGQLDQEALKLYYPLLEEQRNVIDPIIKKYLWAARSSKKAFPWYTGFMNNFWFKANGGRGRFEEEHYGFDENHGADYDLSTFWKIMQYGLTAKDFANIATVDNKRVREIIAMMYGKDVVYPFVNGYAKIASRNQNYYHFEPCAIGFIDTNFNLVVPCKYIAATDVVDGVVKVGVTGEYVDAPDGHDYYKTERSTISLPPKSSK
ncbi:MAG: WG repeat-containing protein [Candidatus Absconditabacterales bacterium]